MKTDGIGGRGYTHSGPSIMGVIVVDEGESRPPHGTAKYGFVSGPSASSRRNAEDIARS